VLGVAEDAGWFSSGVGDGLDQVAAGHRRRQPRHPVGFLQHAVIEWLLFLRLIV
jgi:hypothetical protein